MFGFLRNFWRPTSDEPTFEERQRERVLGDIRERYMRELVAHTGEVDRDEAEGIVARMYEYAGLKAPKEFVWVDHPEDGVVAAVLIAREHTDFVAPRIRRYLVASGAAVPSDDEMRTLSRWLPSLEDACDVFRSKLGARGLLAITKDTPFAIDSWLDAFLALEEEFTIQSPEFALVWKRAAAGIWALSEQEHRDEISRLSHAGQRILRTHHSMWEWSEPFMFAGSMDAIYGAIAEMHDCNTRMARDKTTGTNEGIELLQQYLRHCGWCFPFTDYCIMADRPDELFTLKDIDETRNIEARRLMIELYGMGKYLADKRARVMQKDEYGELYYIPQRDDEPLIVVKVINSTPEPDGTFREYFLRVPPDTKTAREGVAWSFEMNESDYAPSIQT
jgi:hypothetical protein